MPPAVAPVACAAPRLRPSDPPGLAAAGGHPGAAVPPGRAGPRDAFGPRGEAGPPGASAPLDAGAPPDEFELHGGGELLDEAGPPGGAERLVESERPGASGRLPAACGCPAAAVRRATELPHVAASPVSELPAFGLWLHHSEDSVVCQTWG